jgi:hypothetical protein
MRIIRGPVRFTVNHGVAIRGFKSTASNRQFESCECRFPPESAERTAKHSALA